ncbi:MAG: hypothetical protein DRN04_11050 [Thermoprotei archaeon]|nr:MAG: hypothetical protein DRN04_11050 [Thermoprotei archaeon]
MKWEELTSKDIGAVDKETTVVIVPIGSIEVHGPHLPLGTDTMIIYYIALKAAEKEGAIVLPPLYYAYVPENRHFPGTISLKSETFMKLLEDIVEEVYRQGFKKILILNGHGGNKRVLRLFVRKMLEKGFKGNLYVLADTLGPLRNKIDEIRETDVYEHACEIETSLMLFLKPHLVKLDNVKREAKLGKRYLVEYVESMVDWQRYAPEGYVGNPLKASSQKGKELIEYWVEYIRKVIRAIKNDKEYDKVLEKYYSRAGYI